MWPGNQAREGSSHSQVSLRPHRCLEGRGLGSLGEDLDGRHCVQPVSGLSTRMVEIVLHHTVTQKRVELSLPPSLQHGQSPQPAVSMAFGSSVSLHCVLGATL